MVTTFSRFQSQQLTPAPLQVKIDWPPRIDKFDHVDAMISFGEGPEDFWINLVDNDDKLGQLDAKMQQVYASGGSSVPRVFRYWFSGDLS